MVCKWANPPRSLVNHVRVEDVRVGCHHLGGFCGLQALLEGAAIGHTLKRARNELRIIGIAEAGEDLILLVGVEIFARVEGVGMLVESRTVLIGAQPGIRRGKEV